MSISLPGLNSCFLTHSHKPFKYKKKYKITIKYPNDLFI